MCNKIYDLHIVFVYIISLYLKKKKKYLVNLNQEIFICILDKIAIF